MLKITINDVHVVKDEDISKYVTKKIGKLDKYILKSARESAHAEVFLKESNSKDKKEFTCEVIVHLPQDNFAVSETTINIYAAVDIVEAKLKNQLYKYKQKHSQKSYAARLLKPFRKNLK
jgi:ribosomal subunit interface protein